MEYWIQGLMEALQWDVLIAILCGVMAGSIIGAIPGLTATMAIGLLIPLTFKMPTLVGLGLLLGVYVGGYSGGSFSSVLLGIPGTPSNFVTTFDGYPMSEKGQAGKALGTSVITSFIGGIFSAVVLSTLAPLLAKVALKFGPAEYFSFALLGLTLVAGVSGKSLVKGLLAAGIGLLLSYIGTDPMTAIPRFTMGNVNLLRGIPLVPALIGLFAIPPLLNHVKGNTVLSVSANKKISGLFLSLAEVKSIFWILVSSSFIGTFIGILPGTGASIAGFISYDVAKKISKRPNLFGSGIIEGVTASECCNNATTGGALVPLIVLGIPGDAVTAVLLGGLMIQGLTPGPMLFRENPGMIYGIFVTFFVANIFMLVFQLCTVKYYAHLTRIRLSILAPILLFLCCIGSYSISGSMFDVWVMILIGVLGYFLGKMEFPLAPIVLGLVLGPILESNLRRSLIMSGGNISLFIKSPIAIICLIMGALSVSLFVFQNRNKEKHIQQGADSNNG